MRLYFTIEGRQPCPWLEVGRLREGAFKRRLREFIAGCVRRDNQGEGAPAASGFSTYDDLVTYGQKAGAPVQVTREAWEKSGDAVALLVSHVAHVFIDDAPAYNAAKHGVAVIGGEAAVRLGDGEVPNVSGPSLTYLDLRDKDGPAGQKRWNETTAWVTADRSLAIVGPIIDRLDVVWRGARSRYTTLGGFQMRGLARLFCIEHGRPSAGDCPPPCLRRSRFSVQDSSNTTTRNVPNQRKPTRARLCRSEAGSGRFRRSATRCNQMS